MKIRKVTGCCTAKLIYDFPEDKYLNYETLTKKSLPKVSEVIHLCTSLKIGGFAIATAYLTNKQKKSIAVLKKAGFTCSRAVSKSRHPENKLFVLNVGLDKFGEKK